MLRVRIPQTMMMFTELLPKLLSCMAEKEGQPVRVFGVEAWAALMPRLAQVKSVEDMNAYICFKWMGSATEKAQIEVKRMAITAAAFAAAAEADTPGDDAARPEVAEVPAEDDVGEPAQKRRRPPAAKGKAKDAAASSS